MSTIVVSQIPFDNIAKIAIVSCRFTCPVKCWGCILLFPGGERTESCLCTANFLLSPDLVFLKRIYAAMRDPIEIVCGGRVMSQY